ncbi:MAG: hypothetical protein DRJ47_04940 [Thermoprotei archaeon]|nr:MAG: hypothetical protein DRJ47_04940 [Thermoprotei archaeon]
MNHKEGHLGKFRRFPLGMLAFIFTLKVLSEKPTHGYQLAEEISKKLGKEVPRPMIYNILKHLEERGFATSKWEFGESGPARKIYYITEEGQEALKRKIERIRKFKELLEKILE